MDPTEIWVRTSTEDRTLQVAGAMLAAMDPRVIGQPWKVHTQPASVRNPVAAEPKSPQPTLMHEKKMLDRLARPSVPMSRRERGARRIPGGAGVDNTSTGECVTQGASRCRLWYCRARRLGKLV